MALKVAFIGAGNMAQALAKGFIVAGITRAKDITASCPPSDQFLLDQMKSIGVTTTNSNPEASLNSDLVILSVKPQIIPRVLHDIKTCVSPNGPLIASVALGVTTAEMEDILPPRSRIIRVMPNTPALVQSGASVYTRGRHATDEDAQLTARLLKAVGECDEVPETYFDAITALSGAGPAYMYLVLEALADGGVKMGLPRHLAMKLAAQTMKGASKMVQETGKHPGLLKDDVCSPGGCTISGVSHLESRNIRAAMISAVEAATERSWEIRGIKPK